MGKKVESKFEVTIEVEVDFAISTLEEVSDEFQIGDGIAFLYWQVREQSILSVGVRWRENDYMRGTVNLKIILPQAFGKDSELIALPKINTNQCCEISTVNRETFKSRQNLRIVLEVEKQGIPRLVHTDLSISFQTQLVHDVRIYFPRSNQELWCSSSTIESIPYYSEMLQSTWSEGEYHGRFRNSSTSSVSDESDQEDEEEESFEMNLEDSDDELEATEIGLKIKKFKTIRRISIAPYKQINVSHTAFKTFRALLIWLVSGKISFAALRSTSSIEETSSKVSAKSVYRLAHFLDLPELRERAFESLSQQLTRANIHLEIFSPLSVFDEVRSMHIEILCKFWSSDLIELIEELIKNSVSSPARLHRFELVMFDIMRKLRT